MRLKIPNLTLVIFVLLFFAGSAFAGDYLKIHFVDVGEGEAILIQAKNQNALIDTGNLLSGYKLMDYLKEHGINKLKYLIMTHPHADHIAGAFFIMPKIEIAQIFDNAQTLDEGDDMQRLYKRLVRQKNNYRALKKGDRLRLGPVDLDILWPPDTKSASYNENSLVIKLNADNFSCLFTADVGKNIEAQLLGQKADLKSTILKVGHHGYRDATSQDFLDAILPQAAVISTSPASRTGEPSPQTLELLHKNKIRLLRTDKNGDVVIRINESGAFTITTSKAG